jgi:hypothetical protein
MRQGFARAAAWHRTADTQFVTAEGAPPPERRGPLHVPVEGVMQSPQHTRTPATLPVTASSQVSVAWNTLSQYMNLHAAWHAGNISSMFRNIQELQTPVSSTGETMMAEDSVFQWIAGLRKNDQEAVRRIGDRYFDDLVSCAQR